LLAVCMGSILVGPALWALVARDDVARVGWLGIALLWSTLWVSASYSAWRPLPQRGPAAWLSLRFGLLAPVVAGGLAAVVAGVGVPVELTAWIGAGLSVVWMERGLRPG